MGISLGFGFGRHLRVSWRLWPHRRRHYGRRMPRGYVKHPRNPAVWVIQTSTVTTVGLDHIAAQRQRYQRQALSWLAYDAYAKRYPNWRQFYPWYVPPIDPYVPGTHTRLSDYMKTYGR